MWAASESPETLFCVSAERDAFDTLFDHAPDKLSVVKKVSAPRGCVSLISRLPHRTGAVLGRRWENV